MGRADGKTEQAQQGAQEPMRLRILRGAAEVFGKRGYGATSVESILSTARVSRRTFYKHFRSKDDVLRVLFENSVAMLLTAVREANRSERSAEQRIAAGIDAYVRVHARAGALARVLLVEQFSPNSPLARQRDEAMAAFAKLIVEGFAREGLPPPDAILVRGVVAAINEIAVQMASEHPEGNWDVERAKRAMLRVLTALEARGAPSR